jgi:hypothetical protein
MKLGIVICAFGKDYITQAELFVLSLKSCNVTLPVTLITSCKENISLDYFFDNIIEIPNNIEDTFYHVDIRSNIYFLSPYDFTFVFDTDILILENLYDNLVNLSNKVDMFYTSKVFTYRGDEIIKDCYYRSVFLDNNLPNIYNGFSAFKKTNSNDIFFSLLKKINKNWQVVYKMFCPLNTPKNASMDVSTAIVCKILDINPIYKFNAKFVHMKAKNQNWKTNPYYWQDKVQTFLTPNLDFYVETFKQKGIFHYTENAFCNENMVNTYKSYLSL